MIAVTLPGTAQNFVRGYPGAVVVGRSEECTLQLVHPLVSRRHVHLSRTEDGGFVARDLGSRNGTTVNGETLRDAAASLPPGATVQVGPYVLTISVMTVDAETVLADVDSTVVTRVRLDRAAHSLLVDGTVAIPKLSVLEYRLLEKLDSSAPYLVENRALGDAVWEEGRWDRYMLHNLIRRVRRKLEGRAVRDANDLIASVPGVGYRLV